MIPDRRFLVVVFIIYFSVDPILCASAAAKAAELALQNDSSCSLSVSYSYHIRDMNMSHKTLFRNNFQTKYCILYFSMIQPIYNQSAKAKIFTVDLVMVVWRKLLQNIWK